MGAKIHFDAFNRFLLCLLILNLAHVIYALFYSSQNIFDDIEHLRAAYFVSAGDVPYRDFFEHHHPLLWYLLAPLIKLMPNDTALALRIGRGLSFIVSLFCGYFIYKTQKKFIGGKISALICLNLYFWANTFISAHGMFCIKPDIYQRCCFFMGLYSLFCYFDNYKFYNLQVFTLLITISFLFLQTTIFMVAPLAIPICYFIYKNPQKIKDFILSAIAPILILTMSALLLWRCNLWQQYIETNWLLNTLYSKIWLHVRNLKYLTILANILLCAAVAVYYICKHRCNIYIFTIITLFVVEFLLRLFLGTPFMHYCIMLNIYAAMLSALMIKKIIMKHQVILWCFIVISLFYVSFNFLLVQSKKMNFLLKYLPYTKGETVLSDFFQKRQSYYWGYPFPEGIYDMYFRHEQGYDINEKILASTPNVIILSSAEYVYTESMFETLKPTEQQKQIFFHHMIDINKLTDYDEIYKNFLVHKNAELRIEAFTDD